MEEHKEIWDEQKNTRKIKTKKKMNWTYTSRKNKIKLENKKGGKCSSNK